MVVNDRDRMCMYCVSPQLLVHDDVSGLQVLQRGDSEASDRWVDVPRVHPYQVVVQIGQITQRWTNDEYRATFHRVLKPTAPAPSRTTLCCFFRPGIDTLLEVPDSLRRPNGTFVNCDSLLSSFTF